MSEFRFVETVADFRTLDDGDVLEGYLDGAHGGPEPDSTRSRGYWHGWQNAMVDRGRLARSVASQRLSAEFARLQ